MAFFIPGIVGYGGGPSSIPLVQHEVVNRYGWLSVEQFAEVLAIGNSLPGPIATKMAGYIGYYIAGTGGALVALFAIVVPSLLAMLLMLGLLHRFKDSPIVKRMTNSIRPTIAVLLFVLGWQFFASSLKGMGMVHTLVLTVISTLLLIKWRINPGYAILIALVYGAVVL
jgi:chromate transporter